MSSSRLRVGTFLPPAAPTHERSGALGLGKIPHVAVGRFMELTESMEGAHFTHDLDIRRSVVRGGRVWCGDTCLNELDLYFWYAEIDRSPVGYALEALKALSFDTKVVPDPFSFGIGLDKYRAHLTLSRSGARVADSVLFDCSGLDAMAGVMEEWGRVVLKPRRGYLGQGVLLVEDFATLRDMVGYVESVTGGSQSFLAERFYDNHLDDWVSVTLVGGSVLYGFRKKPTRHARMSGGAWKVFDPHGVGGEVELCHPSPAHIEQALHAQKALGADIVGFDMVLHDGEPIIVDENTYPGLYPELLEAVGKDLAEELFQLVRTKLSAF